MIKKVAIVGYGGMGKLHQKCYEKLGMNPDIFDIGEKPDFSKYQAVSICTPNNTHYSLVVEALENGSNVLCEKPLGLTLDEVKEMFQTAEKQKRVLYPAISHAFRVPHLKRSQFVDVRWSAKENRYKAEREWYNDSIIAGDGILLDIGSHYFYIGLSCLIPFEASQINGHNSFHRSEGVVTSKDQKQLIWTFTDETPNQKEDVLSSIRTEHKNYRFSGLCPQSYFLEEIKDFLAVIDRKREPFIKKDVVIRTHELVEEILCALKV